MPPWLLYVVGANQELKKYKPVTPQRLLKPEDGNWLMIRRTYDGWGYSPLDQITPANVAQLKPVWIVLRPAKRASHEAAPIVNNGVMFVTTPNNQVIAFDAHDRHDPVALSPAASAGAHRSARH